VTDSEANAIPGMKSNAGILVVLLCIVGIEVVLTYQHMGTHKLIVSLLVLAFIEAGLAVMYFMHMKYERPTFFWEVILVMLFILLMLEHLWPDALRLEHLRVIHW
jgi:heme/copper-type cytochrome/quinol oxidase subunit 4